MIQTKRVYMNVLVSVDVPVDSDIIPTPGTIEFADYVQVKMTGAAREIGFLPDVYVNVAER